MFFFFVQLLGLEFCCGKDHFIHYRNNPIGDRICFVTYECHKDDQWDFEKEIKVFWFFKAHRIKLVPSLYRLVRNLDNDVMGSITLKTSLLFMNLQYAIICYQNLHMEITNIPRFLFCYMMKFHLSINTLCISEGLAYKPFQIWNPILRLVGQREGLKMWKCNVFFQFYYLFPQNFET